MDSTVCSTMYDKITNDAIQIRIQFNFFEPIISCHKLVQNTFSLSAYFASKFAKRLIWPIERYQIVAEMHPTIHIFLHSIVFVNAHARLLTPETHSKRQATQHDCLPSLLGDGDKGIETVYYFVLGRLEVTWQDKYLLYRHDKLSETTKEGPLLFVLFESPFTRVSTVSRFPAHSLSGYHAFSCSGVLHWNWTPPPSPRQQIERSFQQPSSQLSSYTTVQVPREQQFRYLGNNSSGT